MRVFPVYSSVDVLMFTFKQSKELLHRDIEGCFVECGVAAGSQIGAMQQAMVDTKKKRELWGFDSFCGIPWAGPMDDSQPEIGKIPEDKMGLLETSGVSSHSVENVLSNFALWHLPTDNLHLVEGWFQDTIPVTETGPIAMLRLDGDLYESTKVCLEHLLPKVVKGGLVIIDDYSLGGCRRAVHEYVKESQILLFNETGYFFV